MTQNKEAEIIQLLYELSGFFSVRDSSVYKEYYLRIHAILKEIDKEYYPL